MPFRALIKTHHMTSRKKIQTLSKAAKAHSCAVVFKTGRPPGVMIAEAEDEDNLNQWVDTVKVSSILKVLNFTTCRRIGTVECLHIKSPYRNSIDDYL